MSSALSIRTDRYGRVRKKSKENVAVTASDRARGASSDDRREHHDDDKDQREVRVVDLAPQGTRATPIAIDPMPPTANR